MPSGGSLNQGRMSHRRRGTVCARFARRILGDRAFGGYGGGKVMARMDWGAPRPAEWLGPRETLSARIPVELVARLRSLARSEGVSLNSLVYRLLTEAVEAERAAQVDYLGDLDLVGL